MIQWPEHRSEYFNVRVEPSLKQKVKTEAERVGVAYSELVRKWCQEGLERARAS